jgi:LacI family transcriptional regulator
MAVLLCDTRDDPVREQHHLRNLVARRVDGIIVTGRRTEPRPPVRLPSPIPVVHVFTPSSDPSGTSVVADDAGGARLAVRHLLDLGRRRMVHITGPQSHHAARSRADAAVAAMGEGGAALSGSVQYGEWSERWGRHAITTSLLADPHIDAAVCGSDQIARGVCDALREAGRRVPHDIAVVGFDNWDVMATACRPPLTTVDLRLEELGRCAAQFVLDAIGGVPHPGVTRLAPRLVVRSSTLAE